MDKIVFISVVRDFEMYDRLVRKNEYNLNRWTEFVCFDNREENIGVSERYNSFLESYDYKKPAWFVFCHEDWEAKEALAPKLNKLSKKCLWGSVGVLSIVTKEKIYRFLKGSCEQSNKDGSGLKLLEGFKQKGKVDTVDCQCLIMHSSLVDKYALRFDPTLTFDLYVEDFCIVAYEKHNILSRVVSIKCRHWSFGNITEKFFEAKERIYSKYSGIYANTVVEEPLGNAGERKFISFDKSFYNHQEKYFSNNREKYSIFIKLIRKEA